MTCATPPEDPELSPPGIPGDTRGEALPAQGGSAAPEERPGARLHRVDPALAPGLYVVATPIGNLRDITLRALDVLASADMVYAEDTRVAGKLLSAFGVSARLRPYHDHNGERMRPAILDALRGGARIALMSDAGTPLISDPGFRLVREAAEQGIAVHPLPGASAPLAALAAAGLPTDRFVFAGFPPPRSAARRRWLDEMKTIRATLVMFEGPSRLAESLADMAAVLGPREGVVARELTKKFEEFRRAPLADLAAHYAAEGPPRGEIVVLVGPPGEGAAIPDGVTLDAAIRAADPDAPLKQTAAEIASRFGLSRREVYERALELRDESGGMDADDGDGPDS